MKNKSLIFDALWIGSLVIISRLIPHWPNFTALGAAAILAPRWTQKGLTSVVIPVVALALSDLIFGFYSSMGFTYFSVFFISCLSWYLHQKSTGQNHEAKSWTNPIFLSLISSGFFYVFTNLGVWFTGELYPRTMSGLLLCYWNGLPFLTFEALGTITYVSIGLSVRQFWSKAQVHKPKLN